MEFVTCKKCNTKYEFGEKWFEKHDKLNFICRTCKIKETTRSDDFKKSASLKSKKILANDDIKLKMSQKAMISNFKNSEKISESLKKHFECNGTDAIKKEIKNRWSNKDYRDKISKSTKKQWENPEYRGKILGSRASLNKKRKISLKNHKITNNFTIGIYTFDALIDDIYLYDKIPSQEKKLFVEHNFKKLKYINDLNLI